MDDAARPPVRAHLRFAADSAAFAGLDLAARFDRIHATNLWGAVTSRAGLGSEAGATLSLATALPRLLQRLGVVALLDAPCGDTRWLPPIAGIAYTGVDIVPALIDAARAGGGDYRLADITRDPLPLADTILCRDCLVHLSFANITRAVANFRASGATWLLATTFPGLQANIDCDDGDWRALNFTLPPFGWPQPVETIVEDCTEGSGGWADKAIGVWRLASLA
jgi:hypothetical protein